MFPLAEFARAFSCSFVSLRWNRLYILEADRSRCKELLPCTMYFSQRIEPLGLSVWSQPNPIDILARIRAWVNKKDGRCGSNGVVDDEWRRGQSRSNLPKR